LSGRHFAELVDSFFESSSRDFADNRAGMALKVHAPTSKMNNAGHTFVSRFKGRPAGCQILNAGSVTNHVRLILDRSR
jgi:hypothetical protein